MNNLKEKKNLVVFLGFNYNKFTILSDKVMDNTF